MKKRWALAQTTVVLFFVLFFVGCSTQPRHSGRRGLLDDFFRKSELSDARVRELDRLASRWSPPLKQVSITSPFGRRSGDPHDGVDLRASVGTPVFSVGEGVALFAGTGMSGYGKMIVVRHPGGVSTVYAHNSRLLVRKGQKIRRGQRIALSGRTGRSRGAHLHFEVRSGITAIDPLVLNEGRWWKSLIARDRRLASQRSRRN